MSARCYEGVVFLASAALGAQLASLDRWDHASILAAKGA